MPFSWLGSPSELGLSQDNFCKSQKSIIVKHQIQTHKNHPASGFQLCKKKKCEYTDGWQMKEHIGVTLSMKAVMYNLWPMDIFIHLNIVIMLYETVYRDVYNGFMNYFQNAL